tara:strand:- start:9667 stop:10395 length:729 start_codon:yes stop_codon:yes gene_type:complete
MNIDFEIAIPVLDEETSLESQVEKIKNFLDIQIPLRKIGIVIADNGSRDKTAEIAINLSKQNNIRYINTKQKGVGRALKKAWFTSKAKYVGYMDLDTATDLEHLKEVSELIKSENYEIINGSRYLSESNIRNRKIYRGILSRGFNILIKLLFFSRVSDGMIGFKFLKKDHLDNLIKNGANSDGWIFCTEILLVAEYLKLDIKEIPVNWRDDNYSKVKIFNLIYEYINSLLKLRVIFFSNKFK